MVEIVWTDKPRLTRLNSLLFSTFLPSQQGSFALRWRGLQAAKSFHAAKIQKKWETEN
jgi:hypothetical protein